jgi:hypothetical protein
MHSFGWDRTGSRTGPERFHREPVEPDRSHRFCEPCPCVTSGEKHVTFHVEPASEQTCLTPNRTGPCPSVAVKATNTARRVTPLPRNLCDAKCHATRQRKGKSNREEAGIFRSRAPPAPPGIAQGAVERSAGHLRPMWAWGCVQRVAAGLLGGPLAGGGRWNTAVAVGVTAAAGLAVVAIVVSSRRSAGLPPRSPYLFFFESFVLLPACLNKCFDAGAGSNLRGGGGGGRRRSRLRSGAACSRRTGSLRTVE